MRLLQKFRKPKDWHIEIHYFGSGVTWEENYQMIVKGNNADEAKAAAARAWHWNYETYTIAWRRPHGNTLEVVITQKDTARVSQN